MNFKANRAWSMMDFGRHIIALWIFYIGMLSGVFINT